MGNELWNCGLRWCFVKNSRRFMAIKQLCSHPFLFWSLPNLSSCGLYHVLSGHAWCSGISTGMQVSTECTQCEGAGIIYIHQKMFVFCNHRVKFSLCKSLIACTALHWIFSNEVAKVLPSFLRNENCRVQYISDYYHYWCEFKKLLAALKLWVGEKCRNLQHALANLKQKGFSSCNEDGFQALVWRKYIVTIISQLFSPFYCHTQ